MTTFDERVALLATLKDRLDKASSRLARAQQASDEAAARLNDAQSRHDQIVVLYEKERADVKAAAKETP
jgi:exonuclease VII small subunit